LLEGGGDGALGRIGFQGGGAGGEGDAQQVTRAIF
jgi:hypothetical protein